MRLKQVLINLIKNAMIKTCYQADLNLLVVHVSDTGMGIHADDFEKLFTRFGKLHRTAEHNHEGIGLGLTIVKELVELNGGKVGVHSDGIGKGSTFCFTMAMDEPENLLHEEVKNIDDAEIKS